MFEENIIDAISGLFGMPCVEFSGQKRRGGVIYLTFDRVSIITKNEDFQMIDAICNVAFISISGRLGFGFLSGVLSNFDNKNPDLTIEAIDNTEDRNWLDRTTFEVSKSIRITEKLDYNQTRESIKTIDFKGV